MQVRPRGIAAIMALLFVAGGVLAMRHQATTTHARDLAGAFVHADALAGHHTGITSDIHGQRNPDADTGDCALLTAFHQAASADIAPSTAAMARTHDSDGAPRKAVACVVHEIYRLAPKTSPPVAA